ncbi:MAG: enoyl-CoA hydratase/isomerase family protein [Actinomycetota bacterium]
MAGDEAAEEASAVLYQTVGAVAVVTLNRPSVVNAINSAVRSGLGNAIERAGADPAIRAIVLRGAGDKGFCAGADISEFVPPDSLLEVRDAKQPPLWIDLLADSPKPTIAAIHGYCLGGGLEMALACDIRIAAEGSVFGLPEVTLGIIPGAGGTQRLPRVVGVGHALRMILTGSRIDAARAAAIGLVDEIVAPDRLEEASFALAERFSATAPRAVAAAKEAIRRGVDMPLADGLRLEADLSTLLYATEDRKEGAAAFKERRTPEYLGR